jgi:hypothetical protein
MIERCLRWTAIAIAVAAIIDPEVTMNGRVRPRLALGVEGGASLDLPSSVGTSTRREIARTVVQQLARDLSSDFEFADIGDGSAAAVVVVGDRYPLGAGRLEGPISTISLSSPIAPNVRLAGIDAPRAVPPATAVRLATTVEATGVRGETTTVVVQAGGVEVGRTSHVWSADRETWRAEIDAVPVGAAPFTFAVVAEPVKNERTPLDNAGTVRVDLAPPVRVLVFEGRPSWASAFVRRSLEGDARFHVSQFGRLSPRAVVVSGEERTLSDAALERVDVVIAGGLDGVSAGEVERLDRFVRERGGALVLLPDSTASLSSVRERLSLPATRETLLERRGALAVAAPLTRIDASELIAAVSLAVDADVVARMPRSGDAVIWSVPLGEGRLFFSGALDAWRFRAEPQVEFDRFWRSAIAGLGLAARRPISVSVDGPEVRVELRDRRDATVSSASVVRQPDGKTAEQPIRLLPGSTAGEFFGTIGAVAGAAHNESIAVTATSNQSTEREIVRADPAVAGVPLEPSGPPLSLLASTHGGVDVGPDRIDRLERFLRLNAAGARTPMQRRPMRSVWWIVPFGAALSGEWWLRRRRGAR